MVQWNTAEAFAIIAAPVWIHMVLLLGATGVDSLDEFSGPIDPTELVDFSGATACACPGSSVQYYCTVNDTSGTSTTRWRGSAFTCTGNDASLFHADYMSGSAADPCTDGGFNLTARGLTNITDNCYTSVLSVIIVPGLSGRTVECSFAGTRMIGNDTLQVSVPLPPPSSPVVEQVIPDQSFTVSWTPPPNDCANAVTYTYLTSPDGACGQCTSTNNSPSVICTGWTAQGQNCSFVTRADICGGGQQGEESEPMAITLHVPRAPTITDGMAVFTNSMHSLKVGVSWKAVNSTADIAVSGGQVLLDGTIIEYLVSLDSGKDVTTPCSSPTCSTSVSAEFAADRSGFSVTVAAFNALVIGESDQITCTRINRVMKTVGNSPVDVTLTCTIEPCTIRYGNSSDVYIYDGESGQVLQNLEPNEKYYYQVNFSCGGFDVIMVEDNFTTNENSPPSSGPNSGALAGIIIGVILVLICVQLIGGVAALSVLYSVQAQKRKSKVAADSPSKSTVHREFRINIACVILLLLFLLIPVVGIIVFIMLLRKCFTEKTQQYHERHQQPSEELRATYSPVASEPPSTVAGSEAVSGVKSGSPSPEQQPEIELSVQKPPGELLYAEVGTASQDQKQRNIIPLQFVEDRVNYSVVEVKFTGSHKAPGLQ